MKAGEYALNSSVTELVILAKNGNADAFGELYELYNNEMYKYACCIVKNADLAADAVSDAVYCAFKEIGSLRKPESFKGWLFKILNAACRKYYNQQYEYIEFNPELDAGGYDGGGIDDIEMSMELRRAMNSLTFEERQIIFLDVILEYKSYEIAEILDMPASTVRSKTKRSLKKLREMIEADMNGKEGE